MTQISSKFLCIVNLKGLGTSSEKLADIFSLEGSQLKILCVKSFKYGVDLQPKTTERILNNPRLFSVLVGALSGISCIIVFKNPSNLSIFLL